ncbi:MAG TPA: alpha/beta hydrolase-fold protein [Polyangia bacterium]|jgi:enterochelin esterase family protein|nr:alpha/beta hydrolase-fold protein [Polyangia bacterium]
MLKSKIVPSKWIVLSSALCISLGACSSASGPGAGAGNDAAASGSGGSTAGGSGGTPGAGSGGSGGAGSGSGGSVGNGSGGASATGGSSGSGGGATDGSANTEAGNDATTVPVGTKGVQADPGTDGDGTIPQPPPYPPAPETVARNPGVPVGKVMPYQIYASKSVYPGMKFNYTVYVPAQYQKGKPAAFMVFLDGQHFAGPGTPTASEDYHWNAPILYDNLIAAGQLPVTIVAFQDPGTNTGVYRRGDNFHPDAEERSMEYDQPNDGYARFLINEFIPDAITPNWDIVDDPDGWGIGGHSSGGIAAIEACWFRPDKFRKAHSSSASYPNTSNFPGEPTFPSVFNTVKPPKPIRITMLSGTMDDPGWFAANNNAAMVLKTNGYHYRYRPGMDNHTPPLAAINEFADAMRWLWRGYTLPWY